MNDAEKLQLFPKLVKALDDFAGFKQKARIHMDNDQMASVYQTLVDYELAVDELLKVIDNETLTKIRNTLMKDL